MKNRIVLQRMIVIACLTAALTGCTAGIQPGEWVKLPDGRQVMCVERSGGGVDCDWANAK